MSRLPDRINVRNSYRQVIIGKIDIYRQNLEKKIFLIYVIHKQARQECPGGRPAVVWIGDIYTSTSVVQMFCEYVATRKTK